VRPTVATAVDPACRDGVPAISCKCLNLRWASRLAPCSILRSQSESSSLAPFDDRGYLFSRIVVSVNRMKLGPSGGSQAQAMSPQLSLVIK
jgi:hypothetical protein